MVSLCSCDSLAPLQPNDALALTYSSQHDSMVMVIRPVGSGGRSRYTRVRGEEALMDRREFVKSSAMTAAGLIASAAVPWLSPSAAFGASELARADGKPWKFGVMADTQWGKNVDGQNPGTCAVGIITLLNAEFVRHGVKFVVQVGDLVDKEDDAPNGHAGLRTMPVRAAAAQTLYDNGIGFYPLRGNHEGSVTGANEFARLYPQSRGFGAHAAGADDFSSPFGSLDGLSYSFDFGNVRFVLLDQFVRADGTGYNNAVTTVVDNNILDQQAWIDDRLATRPRDTHAFVLSHKNLIGQNHVDTLFGANPSTNPAGRDAFIRSMQAHGVRYTLGGHDHMHHRSIITSPDGTASVKQIICSSDSYKYYYPAKPSNDQVFDIPAREISAAQELDTFGYYIFTVDGPRLTVDLYTSTLGMDFGDPAGNEDKLVVTPANTRFYKRETFGYSLNGHEFVVAQGGSYTAVQDAFQGTRASILGGVNAGTVTDASGRQLVKTVNTGWSHPGLHDHGAASHVLTLWGIADSLSLWDESLSGLLPGADLSRRGDTIALSLGYDDHAAHDADLRSGRFGIATRDASGHWVNAANRNLGGSRSFVFGPWRPGYGLGSYGVDAHTKTAWAVVNYDGDFAVMKSI